MTRRYKGRPDAAQIERAFPHIVEMIVPLGGFGRQIDTMHAFHADRGLEQRSGRGRRAADRDVVAWCFADRETAEAFAAAFGGALRSRADLDGSGRR